MTDTSSMKGLKRTRKGERFISHEDLTLHCVDFLFADHCETFLPDHLRDIGSTNKDLLNHYLASCEGSKTNESGYTKPKKREDEPWEKHYIQNKNHFFPIKNYICKAFPCLLTREEDQKRIIMECGCGSGSSILPLMKLFREDEFVCFDISATAVEMLKRHEIASHHLSSSLLSIFPYDISSMDSELLDILPNKERLLNSVDHLLMVFVLSSLPTVEDMQRALRRLHPLLRPGRWVAKQGQHEQWLGGIFHFRDYGVLDHNMLRFLEKRKSGDHIPFSFIKGDATHQAFFEKEWIVNLFNKCGFVAINAEYHCNEVVNRKNGKHMRKVFLNAEFGRLGPQ